jgi:hypothetical protein
MSYKKNSIMYFSYLLFSICLFIFFIFFTDPKYLPLPLLLMPVFLLFISFFLIFYWLISKSIFTSKKILRRQSIFMAFCISIIPVMLLALASIKQFTIKDVALATLFFILAAIYFSKIDFIKPNR